MSLHERFRLPCLRYEAQLYSGACVGEGAFAKAFAARGKTLSELPSLGGALPGGANGGTNRHHIETNVSVSAALFIVGVVLVSMSIIYLARKRAQAMGRAAGHRGPGECAPSSHMPLIVLHCIISSF